jgi:hypothetical protein
MQYLSKPIDSKIVTEKLTYSTKVKKDKIRVLLIQEQSEFCAYSEVYIRSVDEVHIEHFDPRLKNTVNDNYQNWYGVLAKMNTNRPKKIEPYLPILHPSSDDLFKRIFYKDGIYQPFNLDDMEANNLIKFIDLNKQEVLEYREKHLKRIRNLKDLCGDDEIFLEELRENKDNLSFATALKHELGIDVSKLL